jgi:hypothetical protein
MNRGIRLITILLVILLVSVSLAWTDSITVRLTSGQAHPDSVGSQEATPLADDNKIVCCWKCPDDGLMKCKVTSVSFCKKMGRQVSSCSECQ